MRVDPRLLDLQEQDSAIDRLEARRAALERGEPVMEARRAADEAERALGELRLGLDELDREASRLEHEIDSIGRKAADEEARLYDGSVANARELDAIRREVENLRGRAAAREDELLAVMERREAIERDALAAEARAAELRGEVDRVRGDAERELAAVLEELRARTRAREALAEAIDAELLDLYERLRRQKKGVGAAALVDGVCQGCHEQLSAVELDRLKRGDGIPRCEHCRRILVP
ncbi:MAG: hypothetical protein KatS3mg013_0669 [Actinomycetota bacterium]|jgi:predicted  nucleic acid-binding Zn-ribbon protein|nr:MAG: hypothetical protein KatS3mg013_0669 [Actinomycetota bacterium]